MPNARHHFPVLLTQAQRKAVTLLLPDLTGRLKLDEKNQRAIPFSVSELKEIATKSRAAVRHAESPLHIHVIGDPKITLGQFWQEKKCLAVWEDE